MTERTPISIVRYIQSVRFENTFNPYSERCDIHDTDESPAIRATLLEDILKSASSVEIDAIWIGRDLGHRGGRRTGLALTDDLNFEQHISRWGLTKKRPTAGLPVGERTASVVWDMLRQVSDHVFLWNVFPLHPYESGNVFSNRAHNAKERYQGEIILTMLAEFLKPKRVVAIGNDAAKVAQKVLSGIEIVHVRHPSYGGQKEFSEQVSKLYNFEFFDSQPRLI